MKINVNGETLEGEFSCPHEPKALIIFAHGFGSSYLTPQNKYVAEKFFEQGFATLLFDLLTKHEEVVDLKGGFFKFNIPFLTERLLKTTHFIAKDPRVAHLPFGYFGAGTLGVCALQAALQVNPFAIVLREARPDLAGVSLKTLKAPTLFIVGSEDSIVIKLNQRVYRDLQCEKRLTLVEGATHLFEEEGALEKMTENAIDWFLYQSLHLMIK